MWAGSGRDAPGRRRLSRREDKERGPKPSYDALRAHALAVRGCARADILHIVGFFYHNVDILRKVNCFR